MPALKSLGAGGYTWRASASLRAMKLCAAALTAQMTTRHLHKCQGHCTQQSVNCSLCSFWGFSEQIRKSSHSSSQFFWHKALLPLLLSCRIHQAVCQVTVPLLTIQSALGGRERRVGDQPPLREFKRIGWGYFKPSYNEWLWTTAALLEEVLNLKESQSPHTWVLVYECSFPDH